MLHKNFIAVGFKPKYEEKHTRKTCMETAQIDYTVCTKIQVLLTEWKNLQVQ